MAIVLNMAHQLAFGTGCRIVPKKLFDNKRENQKKMENENYFFFNLKKMKQKQELQIKYILMWIELYLGSYTYICIGNIIKKKFYISAYNNKNNKFAN